MLSIELLTFYCRFDLLIYFKMYMIERNFDLFVLITRIFVFNKLLSRGIHPVIDGFSGVVRQIKDFENWHHVERWSASFTFVKAIYALPLGFGLISLCKMNGYYLCTQAPVEGRRSTIS